MLPKETSPIFRLATTADVDQLVHLRVLMQREVNATPETKIESTYAESVRQYFERSISNGSYISAVAEVAGKLVSANGLVSYNKPPSLGGGTGRVGYVSNVYTLPEWRGRGIASELMKIVVEHARRIGADKLHLGATDLGKGVYERVGFKPVRFAALELKF